MAHGLMVGSILQFQYSPMKRVAQLVVDTSVFDVCVGVNLAPPALKCGWAFAERALTLQKAGTSFLPIADRASGPRHFVSRATAPCGSGIFRLRRHKREFHLWAMKYRAASVAG
jgi:hypothetical protein